MTAPTARRRAAVLAALVATLVASAGCGGDDDGGDRAGGLLIDRIDDAIEAVEAEFGTDSEYLLVTAGAERIELVRSHSDGRAERLDWTPEGGIVGDPTEIDAPFVETFVADDIDVDPDRVLSQVRNELPESEIIDFAVRGGAGDVVSYDVLVRSQLGGTLLILVGPTGQILGTGGG